VRATLKEDRVESTTRVVGGSVATGTLAGDAPGAVSVSAHDAGYTQGPRLVFIDNIRWVTILLVVSMHAADTYSPLGNWYYVDRTTLSTPVLLTFVAWQTYLQAFFMGLLFFIAGYFVPGSLERRGRWPFVRERGFRLGLPVLFYMFVLGPITEYFVAHSWNSTEPTSFVNEWVKHIRNGQFLQENGPLWFCLALLIFSMSYAIAQSMPARRLIADESARAPGTGSLIGFALVMAISTFLVRLVLPSGTSVLNMQLADFPQYTLLFVAGTLAAREQWFRKLHDASAARWLTAVLPIGFASWLVILFTGGALSGNGSAYAGGWHWQAAAMNLWESFTCVAICFGLLTLFQRTFNARSRFTTFMSANAFSVYVFHPPIVILGARVLHATVWHPLAKFVALTCISIAGSFLLSAAVFRRTPALRRIL
jgi:fucose 4-O-acetylase-like acetyltransferase